MSHCISGSQRVLYRTVRCRQSRDSWQKDTAPTRRSVGNGQRDHRMLTQTGRRVTRPYEQREVRRQHVRLEPDISPHRAGYSEALCKLFHILFWREFVNQPIKSACKCLKEWGLGLPSWLVNFFGNNLCLFPSLRSWRRLCVCSN